MVSRISSGRRLIGVLGLLVALSTPAPGRADSLGTGRLFFSPLEREVGVVRTLEGPGGMRLEVGSKPPGEPSGGQAGGQADDAPKEPPGRVGLSERVKAVELAGQTASGGRAVADGISRSAQRLRDRQYLSPDERAGDAVKPDRFEAVVRVGDRTRWIVGGRPCARLPRTRTIHCEQLPDPVAALNLAETARQLIVVLRDGRRLSVTLGDALVP